MDTPSSPNPSPSSAQTHPLHPLAPPAPPKRDPEQQAGLALFMLTLMSVLGSTLMLLFLAEFGAFAHLLLFALGIGIGIISTGREVKRWGDYRDSIPAPRYPLLHLLRHMAIYFALSLPFRWLINWLKQETAWGDSLLVYLVFFFVGCFVGYTLLLWQRYLSRRDRSPRNSP